MKHALLLISLAQIPFTVESDSRYIRAGGTFFVTQAVVTDATSTVRGSGDDAGTSFEGNRLIPYGSAVRIECTASSTSPAVFCWSHSPGTVENGSITVQNGANTGLLSDSEGSEPLTGPASGEASCFIVSPSRIIDEIHWRGNYNGSKAGFRQGVCTRGSLYKYPCNENSDCGTNGICTDRRQTSVREKGGFLLNRAQQVGGAATCLVSLQS